MGIELEQEISQLFNQAARLQSWLEVEAVLARCQARLGIISQEAATEITKKAFIENIDMDQYERLYIETKHPLVPLLHLLRKVVGPMGEYLHYGATTHDIVDIAKIVAMKKVWDITERTLLDIEQDILRLTEEHASTIMAGRSHNIQALPITFGFKTAIWASELRRGIERLQQNRERIFVVTFSGANGTMASFGGYGNRLEKMIADEFKLGIPDISWHAARDRIAEMASTLAIIGGTLSRIAQEVYLLMGTEIGELLEGYSDKVVGSSTMPHKINPINSQHILGDARTLRYDAAHIIECMQIDHEHNLVHFDDERRTLERIGLTMADLLSRSKEMISTLYVDKERMRKNLDILQGAVQSENVMLEFGKIVGKMTAKDIITELAIQSIRNNKSLADLLKNDDRVNIYLDAKTIDQLLDPTQYAEDAATIAMDYVRKTRELLTKR